MRWSARFSVRTGWKVPAPTCSVTLARRTPRSRKRGSTRVVEVQRRGGRGDGARTAREHRLVALGVLGVVGMRDVRRQRHVAVALEQRERIARASAGGTARRPARSGRAPRRRRRRRRSATTLPGFGDLLARRCAHTSRVPGSTRSTSASTAPPLRLSPNSRALITRVSLKTSRSPAFAAARAGRGTCGRPAPPPRAVEQARGAALGGRVLGDQLGRQREVEVAGGVGRHRRRSIRSRAVRLGPCRPRQSLARCAASACVPSSATGSARARSSMPHGTAGLRRRELFEASADERADVSIGDALRSSRLIDRSPLNSTEHCRVDNLTVGLLMLSRSVLAALTAISAALARTEQRRGAPPHREAERCRRRPARCCRTTRRSSSPGGARTSQPEGVQLTNGGSACDLRQRGQRARCSPGRSPARAATTSSMKAFKADKTQRQAVAGIGDSAYLWRPDAARQVPGQPRDSSSCAKGEHTMGVSRCRPKDAETPQSLEPKLMTLAKAALAQVALRPRERALGHRQQWPDGEAGRRSRRRHSEQSAPRARWHKLGLTSDIDLALHLPLRYEDETRLVRDRRHARRRRRAGRRRRARCARRVPRAPPARGAARRRQRRADAALPALLSVASEDAARRRAGARARRAARRVLRPRDGAPDVQGGRRRHAAGPVADAGVSGQRAAAAGVSAQGHCLGAAACAAGRGAAGRHGAGRPAEPARGAALPAPSAARRERWPRSTTTAIRRGSG